jgi:hypothetical protein
MKAAQAHDRATNHRKVWRRYGQGNRIAPLLRVKIIQYSMHTHPR